MAAKATFLSLSVLAVSLSEPAAAQQRHQIALPAGKLKTSIILLGRQARISIGLGDQRLGPVSVRSIRGRFTAGQALERLLRGTPARAVQVGVDSWLVEPRRQPSVQARRLETAKKISPPARSQPSAGEDYKEIIVTGSKRGLPLRDYPGSVDLVASEDLDPFAQASGTHILVSKLPALTSTHLGSGRNKLFIRGIADSSFNGPTQATVGQYLGETRLNYNAPDPDLRLYDIEAVEVLKGPQGTLFGAGSVGGILRLVPRSPRLDHSEASAAAALSNTAHGGVGHEVSGIINLPLSENELGLRAVAYAVHSAGYVDDTRRKLNDVNEANVHGGRLSLRWAPTNQWRIDVMAMGQSIRGKDGQYADRDGPPLTRASSVAQPWRNDYGLASVTVQKDWGPISLVSAAGLVRQRLDETYDASRPSEATRLFRQVNDISVISWESRLSRKPGEGLSWVVGTSLLRSRSELDRQFETMFLFRPMTGVMNGIDEATFFGEAGLPLASDVTVTLGSRFTHSRLLGQANGSPAELFARNAAVSADRSETVWLPSAALSFEPGDRTHLYLRYQEGFRPGGLGLDENLIQRFKSDGVASMEAGFRYGSRTASLYLSASAAYTRWSDIQADTVDGGGFPVTSNIGDGEIYSIDAAASLRLARGLFLELGGIFNHSMVTDPAPSIIMAPSSTLPNIAKLNGRAGLDYHSRLHNGWDLDLTAWLRYVGRNRLGVGAVLGELQGDYLDSGTSLRLSGRSTGFSIGVTNLLDKVGNRFSLGSPFTIIHGRQITPLRPRTLTIGLDVSF